MPAGATPDRDERSLGPGATHRRSRGCYATPTAGTMTLPMAIGAREPGPEGRSRRRERGPDTSRPGA